jgi:hypothetical protein
MKGVYDSLKKALDIAIELEKGRGPDKTPRKKRTNIFSDEYFGMPRRHKKNVFSDEYFGIPKHKKYSAEEIKAAKDAIKKEKAEKEREKN